MDAQPTDGKFEGWAIVELFGHQREVGYVTTQVFGAAVLFRIDTPELPEREYVLQRPAYAHMEPPTENSRTTKWCPEGSKVRRQAVPARTKLVGPSAIYAMTPCTEQTARMAIERSIEPPLILLELAEAKTLPAADDHICAECGESLIGGEPHRSDCSLYEDERDEGERCCSECGATSEEGHEDGCSFDNLDDDDHDENVAGLADNEVGM
jgi:hypothetical protein